MTAAGWAHESYEYRRVKWPSLEEAETWWQITGGHLEFSALTDLKQEGQLEFEGTEVPNDRDLVRVYHSHGGQEPQALATLMFAVSQPVYDGVTVRGTMECRSVLSVVASKRCGAPFVAREGEDAVALAASLVRSLGLKVNAPESSRPLPEGRTFTEDEADYLTIVNWLLSQAGYSSAWVDASGEVQMTEYEEPSERTVLLTLRDDEDSIMLPELVRRSDYADTPNAVRLLYESDDECLSAWALNVDPESRTSILSRGYEVTESDTVSGLEGESAEDRLAALTALAVKTLADSSLDVEYVDGACQYVPELMPNNAVSVEYGEAGVKWTGCITDVRVQLDLGMQAEYSARRFVRTGLKVDSGGEILYVKEVEEDA